MNEVATAATSAASNLATKDDRYLMIYAVCLLIIGGAAIIWKLGKFLEKLSDKQSEQTERLIAVTEKNNGVIERCNDSLDNNTRMLERASLRLPQIP